MISIKYLSALAKKLKTLHRLSKISIAVGSTAMTWFYIIALAAKLLTPYAADYYYAMSVYQGALQAAPACLAVGVAAGLLGDLMLRGSNDSDAS